MDTNEPLFPNRVKWSLIPYKFIDLNVLIFGSAMLSSACVDIKGATLEYRDGALYACYDASSSEEDKCYKVEELKPLHQKSTATPE